MMNVWRWLRNLDRINTLINTGLEFNRQIDALTETNDQLSIDLSRERDRRIAAETLAAERSKRIDFLADEVRYLREQAERIIGERLKSLDALNVRLMEPRVEPPPPDLKQFRPSPEQIERMQANVHAVRRARDAHRAMDMALLGALHPAAIGKRAPAGPTNVPQPTIDESGAA